MSYINNKRKIANVECETLVDKIKGFTKVEPETILVEGEIGATMKFVYTFFNGTLAFTPLLTEDDKDYCIGVVAQGNNGVVAVDEIPLGETPLIRFALLNKICKAASVIDFDKK